MEKWKPSNFVWLALVVGAALWCLAFAAVDAYGQEAGVAFSGPMPDRPDMTVLVTCMANDEEPRCALAHVTRMGTADEVWVMGAGPMDVPADAPEGGFCITADVALQGNVSGPTGPFPPLMGKRACFTYLEGEGILHLHMGDTFIVLTADPELLEKVMAEERAAPQVWGT